jgi:hypothetical protein
MTSSLKENGKRTLHSSSIYLNDNAFVEAILYEKKNGYFSFFFIS